MLLPRTTPDGVGSTSGLATSICRGIGASSVETEDVTIAMKPQPEPSTQAVNGEAKSHIDRYTSGWGNLDVGVRLAGLLGARASKDARCRRSIQRTRHPRRTGYWLSARCIRRSAFPGHQHDHDPCEVLSPRSLDVSAAEKIAHHFSADSRARAACRDRPC